MRIFYGKWEKEMTLDVLFSSWVLKGNGICVFHRGEHVDQGFSDIGSAWLNMLLLTERKIKKRWYLLWDQDW